MKTEDRIVFIFLRFIITTIISVVFILLVITEKIKIPIVPEYSYVFFLIPAVISRFTLYTGTSEKETTVLMWFNFILSAVFVYLYQTNKSELYMCILLAFASIGIGGGSQKLFNIWFGNSSQNNQTKAQKTPPHAASSESGKVQEVNFCPFCGGKVDGPQNYCRYCGKPLKGEG